jgi:hypothetical protein
MVAVNCPERRHWLTGRPLSCQFEARYDEIDRASVAEDPPALRLIAMSDGNPVLLRSYLYRRVYVRDVCVRCGKTLERNP